MEAKQTGHTPIESCILRGHGPFVYVEFSDGCNELVFDGHTIAHLLPEGDDSATRLASLIAAAPDLLEACEDVRTFLCETFGDVDEQRQQLLLEQLDAAIAKATA